MTSTNEFVMKINNTKFDEIAYRMISENEIYGLVNFDVEKSKIETVVQYINDKYIPLSKYFEDEISKVKLLNIFRKYFAIKNSLPGYLLNENQIVLDINSVYIDTNNDDIWFIYIPDLEYTNTMSELDFIRKIVFSVRYNPKEDSSYIIQIMNYLNMRDGFTIDGFKNLINELSELDEIPVVESDSIGDTVFLTDINSNAYIIRENNQEKIYISDEEFIIGKDFSKVDYCIADNNAVSRMHAELRRVNDEWNVIDLNSLNGTFVNGEKLDANVLRKLKSNDVIFLADEVFTYYKS